MSLSYIYLITNNINGKTYIGMRSAYKGEDIHADSYMGSGILLIKAMKRYGKENFTKIILISGDYNKDELGKLEKQYITYYKSHGKAEYNIAMGGEGGNLGKEVNSRIAEASKLSMQNMTLRKRISEKLKGRKLPIERNIKCSETHKGMKWFTDGVAETQSKQCPLGFRPGRLHKKEKKPLLTKDERRVVASNTSKGGKNPRAIPVKCIELNKEFSYTKEAVYYFMKLGILNKDRKPQQYITMITDCCKGVRDKAFGYTWEFCHLPHCNSGKDFIPSRMIGE